jgi:hypothetical protein
MLEFANDEFRGLLLLNYCGQDFRSRAFELAAASGDALLSMLEQALAVKELSFSGAIAAALVLTRARGTGWGQDVPPHVRRALIWDLRCGTDVEAAISLEAYRKLSPEVAGDLLRECLREERAIALIPAVRDDRVISDLISRVESSGEVSDVAVEALVACRQRAVPLLMEICEGKVAAPVGVLAAEVLGRVEPPPVRTLVRLLGHPSKRVTSVASKAIERLDEAARSELELSKSASKKSVRLSSQRLLAKLGDRQSASGTPLSEVRRRVELMPVEQREAFVAQWRAAGDSEQAWQAKLRPKVIQLGATALELLRQWFVERLEEGETRLWCYAVEELRGDVEAVWVAVDTFARMPKLAASLWARPRRALSHCGKLLAEPIVFVLRNVPTEYREALFGLLAAQAAGVEHGVFLAGLSDPSKIVRTHSVDGLSRVSDGPLTEVAELLAASEIGTRIAAAELLAVWGRGEVGDLVADAWQRERSGRVRPYLEDTLVACGRQDLVFASPEGQPIGVQAARSFLGSQRLPKKWPAFMAPDELPPLHWRDGQPLSDAERRGFFARLMMLDLTLKGRTLRQLLPLLADGDVLGWSRSIYEGWARARNAKHKWAIVQLSLLADDALIGDALQQLGRWRGREHTAISCHLRAAQWHGSDISVQWLGYWSENLASLGGRATALQLLGRVAFKQGCSVAELRRSLNPFIAEELAEHQLSGELAEGYPRARMLQELERAWLTGRTWRAPALRELLMRQVFLGGDRLIWRTLDGKLVRFVREGERGSLCGFDESPVSEDERLRLAHPLDFEPAELALWRGVSAQNAPIRQLDRDCYDPERLPELSGIEVTTQRFSEWRRRHRWFHGEPMDAGIVYTDSLHLPGRNLIVTLHHSGYGIGAGEFEEDVRLLGLDFASLDGEEIAALELPRLVYSELHYSMLELGTRD